MGFGDTGAVRRRRLSWRVEILDELPQHIHVLFVGGSALLGRRPGMVWYICPQESLHYFPIPPRLRPPSSALSVAFVFAVYYILQVGTALFVGILTQRLLAVPMIPS